MANLAPPLSTSSWLLVRRWICRRYGSEAPLENSRRTRAASAPRGKCAGRPGLALWSKQLAPTARADVALNEFTRFRRLEIDAAVAVLIALRRALIFGVRLADLLLRRRLRDRRSDCRRAECKRSAGQRHTA